MAITCLCPKCRKTLAISEAHAGQPMRCPLCQAIFQGPTAPPIAVGASRPTAPPPRVDAPQWAPSSVPPEAPTPTPSIAPELADLGSAFTGRLQPGWHMVRRGMAIIPTALLIATFVLLGSRAFLSLYAPEPKTYQTVMLVTVPITVLATVAAIIGGALCGMVPVETGLRRRALIAVACLLAALFLALLTLGLRVVFPGKAGRPETLAPSAFIPADLLAFAGGVVFLYFLRGVADHFNNQRLSRAVLWCLGAVGASPLVFFLLYLLLWMTNAAVGGDGTGRDVLAGFLLYVISGVDLFWFLHVLNDVRRTVEKRYLGAMA